MSKKLTPYEKAGRLFRLFGWIQLIAGSFVLIAVAIPHIVDEKMRQQTQGTLTFLIVMIVLFGISVFQLVLGKAIKEHKEWGRTAGIILAIIQLFGFPIGTLIGGYILWCLLTGWSASRDVEPAAGTDAK